MQERQAECAKVPSQDWNCRLNRCMTTQQAYQTREDFQQCQQLEEGTTKEQCFLRLAQEKTNVKAGQKSKDGALGKISVGLSGAYALMGGIALASKTGGKCKSRNIMTVGSGLHLATHFLILQKSKKKFDDIAARAKSSANDYNAQMRAFQLLKEEQQAVHSYAKKKKLVHTVVGLTYAGALAMAIAEKTSSFGMKPCATKEEDAKNKREEADQAKADYKRAKDEHTIFQRDKLKQFEQKAKTAEMSAQKAADAAKKPPGLLSINSSNQVAIFSGVGMALSFKLRQAAADEEKKAQRNIAHIDKIIAEFESTMARYCPNGREDLKDPSCYCYTDKGEPNPQRTKSNMCQNLWKKDNVNYAVKAGTYPEKEGGPEGCLALNGKFDPDCECRKFKNTATGKNLCAKLSTNVVIPSALQGNLSGVGTALKAADVLTGASSNAGALNSEALAKAAAKTRRYAENLLKKYNRQAASRNMTPLPLTPGFVEKAVTGLADARMRKRFGTGKAAAPLSSLSATTSPAIKDAIKKIQPQKSTLSSTYQKTSKKTSPAKKSAPFQWGNPGSSNPQGKTLHLQEGEAIKEHQKNADLHTNSTASIWKLISKRYMVSALPTLFPEKSQ